jgi:hypothetical protein
MPLAVSDAGSVRHYPPAHDAPGGSRGPTSDCHRWQFRPLDLAGLNLNDEDLLTLQATFSTLTSLTTLNLGGNQLSTVPEALGALTSLTELNLGNRNTYRPSSGGAFLIHTPLNQHHSSTDPGSSSARLTTPSPPR